MAEGEIRVVVEKGTAGFKCDDALFVTMVEELGAADCEDVKVTHHAAALPRHATPRDAMRCDATSHAVCTPPAPLELSRPRVRQHGQPRALSRSIQASGCASAPCSILHERRASGSPFMPRNVARRSANETTT